MKIETNKNNHHERKDSSVKKSESALHKFLNHKDAPDAKPTVGAFEKILAETRKQTKADEPFVNLKNSDNAEVKTDEPNDSLEVALTGKDELEEKAEREEGGSEQTGGDESSQFASGQVIGSNLKSAPENPVAAARSILHVADLERIVATIRTETFKNAKQVQIALKNSVLKGLEIKLTIDANGKLKAEFLSQDAQVTKQLNVRKRELNEIFIQRSVNFSDIEVVEKA
ncbi:MAG: hypothetical protein LUM44_04675 [Pyrinomonadaceae bacterium]|nr:hypothetical protein [Pyrinomonadaceae bacterium]